MEIWKDIPEFVGSYECSSLGNVRRIGAKKYLSKTINKDGYISHVFSVNAVRTNVLAHRVIASTFIGPCPFGQVTRHKDGIRINNAEHNLQYGTPVDNSKDMIKHNTQSKGITCARSKLIEDNIRDIRASTETHEVLAKRFNTTQGNISQIKNRITWKHI